jgi:hypothetical protein
MENKKFMENDFVKSFMAEYTKVNGAEKAAKLTERVVGNNGYVVGQSFTLTGEIQTKTNTINGVTQVYIILPTKEGTELSLMSLMGVSSLKGYDLTNEIEVEFDVDGEKKTRKIKSDVTEASYKRAWQPASRNLLELASMIADGTLKLAGKKVTFLGTAVKPFPAKQAGSMNGEEYQAGYQRAIETKLWSIN